MDNKPAPSFDFSTVRLDPLKHFANDPPPYKLAALALVLVGQIVVAVVICVLWR